MLFLFRKIRQKLLQEWNVIDYLKNAVGEFFLGADLRRRSPFRDLIWVELTVSDDPAVLLGTGYIRNLSELQIILRTCLPDRQAYGTLFLLTDLFSTHILPPEMIGIFYLRDNDF
ncbi:hypothetical protein M3O96_01100 [Aquiflexum sp. TKW24L]|uniref:hypothetical protein n=1 Tax=Aquiflexum sp. TKW24L TaxID=2942212 RepID=UPI0020BF927F|nr:hypothetical protein [Aquiflexum sp. TKW24L]MCL6257664.1 hypothetical protein [Aquiflexum sp. TKW24L]